MKKPQKLLMSILFFNLFFLFLSCQKDQDLFVETIEQEIEKNIEESQNEENNTEESSDTDIVIDDNISNELLAFPSAEGAGAYASGGRGGEVLFVTSLSDDGSEGTFRWALEQTGPRIIVFTVSGEIELRSTIYISGQQHGNLTVAGQSAPNGGITIKGAPIQFDNMQNIIIRYIRIRPFNSQGSGEGNDALTCMGCRYVIYDHLSVSGGGDETIDFWHFGGSASGNVTVQRVLTGESQNGGLAGGEQTPSVWNTLTYFSSHHNLSIHGYNRMPSNAAGGTHEYINNLVANWNFKLISAEGNAKVNHVNNYYRPGESSNVSKGDGLNLLSVKSGHDVKVYTEGNFYEGMQFASNNNQDAWTISVDGSPVNPPNSLNSYFPNGPFNIEGVPVTATSAQQALSDVTNDVGSNKYLNDDGTYGKWLDALDIEYINDFMNDTYTNCKGCNGWVWYEGGSYDYPTIPENQRGQNFDTDFDGMPDIWEVANFGDLSSNSYDDSDGDGYTNIEEYLNSVDN